MASSTASRNLLMRIMSASVAVANHSGKIIREIMKKGDLGIVEKEGIHDLQTEADRSVQRYIISSLSSHFPKVTIIGEEVLENQENPESVSTLNLEPEILEKTCPEAYASIREEDVVIWVDPLDGTAEYTQGLLDHVTVLIGLAVGGKAIAGVINQPYFNYKQVGNLKLGRTMWGIVGLGAFGIEHKLPPNGKNIVTTTRSHSNAIVKQTMEAMKPDEILRVGGAGHKVLMLIEGVAHAYVFPSPGCKKWDTCAPEAILNALGGKLTDIHGNTLQYHAEVEHINASGVLATYSASVHDFYQNCIPQATRDALPSKY